LTYSLYFDDDGRPSVSGSVLTSLVLVIPLFAGEALAQRNGGNRNKGGNGGKGAGVNTGAAANVTAVGAGAAANATAVGAGAGAAANATGVNNAAANNNNNNNGDPQTSLSTCFPHSPALILILTFSPID
jgi:hypothetical protein